MIDVLIIKFTNHFIPEVNEINDSTKFNQRVQSANESVENFIIDLQKLVKTWGYSDPDCQVRNRFVAGLRDLRLQEKLQLTVDLTLNKAVEIARRHEMIKSQVQEQNHTKLEADAVRSHHKFRGRGRGRHGHQRYQQQQHTTHSNVVRNNLHCKCDQKSVVIVARLTLMKTALREAKRVIIVNAVAIL